MSKSTTKEAEALVISTEDVQDVSMPTTAVETYSEDSEITAPIEAGKSAEITRDDIILPSLRIAHKTGKLGEDFQVGSYVMDGMTQVTEFFPKEDRSTKLEITVLEIQKSFVENVEWGSGQIPNRLYSERAVYDEKKTITYWTDDNGERQEPHYWPTFDCRILLKRPTEEIKTLQPDGSMQKGEVPADFFPIKFKDNDYAMLSWVLQRSGYTRAGKRIMSAFANGIFPCLSCGNFLLSTTAVEFKKGNATIVPELSYGTRHDDEFVEFCEPMTKSLPQLAIA